jgi:UDP:flavonoid glycosyltransferase YjiC (YdhE family)
MLGVVRAVQRAGHEVLVATHAEFHPALASLELPGFEAGLSEQDLLAERLRRWPETADMPPREFAQRMFTDIAAPEMATDLASLVDRGWPDLILSEEGEYGGRLIGPRAGVPVVTHGWGSPPTAAPPASAVVPHIDPCPPSLSGHGRVSSGWRLRYEVPRLVAPSAETTSWVNDRRRPLAYVGFGTVPLYRDHADVPQVLAALNATGFDTVCTVPDPTEPALCAAAGPDTRFEKFVSLPDLLPRCAVVVSHGGAGTTLAALAHGLPLLVLPQGAPSQQRMANACAARGAARCLEAGDITAPRLRQQLAALLDDPRHRAAAKEVADELAAAPAADTIVELLTDLAAAPRTS